MAVVTYNLNGFWSKLTELSKLLDEEDLAVLAIQETLVSDRHYPLHLSGYRAKASNAKEDFRGITMLVDNRLASYVVPHGVCWLLHVKVFNYAGIDGPTQFINVYLKSGGNHCWTQWDQFTVVKNIVAKILERDDQSRVVVLGDMNEAEKALVHHLNIVGDTCTSAPLHHWAQIGRCMEMRVWSNKYQFPFMDQLIAEITGEIASGAQLRSPTLNNDTSLMETWWTPQMEYALLKEGMVVPSG